VENVTSPGNSAVNGPAVVDHGPVVYRCGGRLLDRPALLLLSLPLGQSRFPFFRPRRLCLLKFSADCRGLVCAHDAGSTTFQINALGTFDMCPLVGRSTAISTEGCFDLPP
jgi:hypothetical protein